MNTKEFVTKVKEVVARTTILVTSILLLGCPPPVEQQDVEMRAYPCNRRCDAHACYFSAGEWAVARVSSHARPLRINPNGNDPGKGPMWLLIDEVNGTCTEHFATAPQYYKHACPR